MRIATYNIWNSQDGMPYRKRHIAEEIDKISAILAGDFNCTETSDVNRFLLGECLLGGKESKYNWYDLALSYAERIMSKPDHTLNFTKNPRFTSNTIEVNSRVDRIMLRNTYPMEFPKLKNCHIFGQKIYDETKLAASDHYGVLAEIDF